MTEPIRFFALAAIFAAGTVAFGWWVVPVAGAVFGVLTAKSEGAVWESALAGGLAWGGLLVITATQGPVGALARRAAGALGLPGFVLFGATVAFPAIVAALATATGRFARNRLAPPPPHT